MIISGLQKMTLLDFPGKVACTVFLPGCNFRCPFCHNSGLLGGEAPPYMDENQLLAFLQKRVGLLDGVCITGGEPTLQPALPALLRQIRALGFATKLDTNGSRPEVLKALAAEGLLDYVAMDIKNSPARYCETAGMAAALLPKIEESARFLLTGTLDYEFRTTVVDEFHDEASVADMGRWLRGLAPEAAPKRFFLQQFADRDSVLQPGLHAPTPEKMAALRDSLLPYCPNAALRGVDA
jgi:pyruvate formate lyase activating enzyme